MRVSVLQPSDSKCSLGNMEHVGSQLPALCRCALPALTSSSLVNSVMGFSRTKTRVYLNIFGKMASYAYYMLNRGI